MANQATQSCVPVNLDALPDSHLLTPAEAASILGVTEGTLSVWRSVGRYNLEFTRIGRLPKYRAGALREFIKRRTATHTGQKPATNSQKNGREGV